MASKTQITTGRVRFSYVHAFTPKPGRTPSEDDKYSVTLLIPKTDKHTMGKIQGAMDAAKEAFRLRNPGKKLPPKMATTLHDGDGLRDSGEEFGPECKGCYVMTVSTKNRPVVVYADKTPMTDPMDLYSGCYGRAVINFYVYDYMGRVGISAGLNGLMKLSDGEPLAGGVVTDADWDDDWEDEDEDDYGGLL